MQFFGHGAISIGGVAFVQKLQTSGLSLIENIAFGFTLTSALLIHFFGALSGFGLTPNLSYYLTQLSMSSQYV